jgi:hypothetical protein
MSHTLRFILSLSIIFAVIIGIVRYRKIDRSYYPFLYYITLVLIIEVVVNFLVEEGQWQIMSVMLNFYTLAEFGLLAWTFHAWGLFNRNKVYTGLDLYYDGNGRHHHLQLLFPRFVFVHFSALCCFNIQQNGREPSRQNF